MAKRYLISPAYVLIALVVIISIIFTAKASLDTLSEPGDAGRKNLDSLAEEAQILALISKERQYFASVQDFKLEEDYELKGYDKKNNEQRCKDKACICFSKDNARPYCAIIYNADRIIVEEGFGKENDDRMIKIKILAKKEDNLTTLNIFRTANKEFFQDSSDGADNTGIDEIIIPYSIIEKKYPEIIKEYLPAITAAAQENQIPIPLVIGMISRESSGKYDTISYCGAVGLIQLMPETAKYLGMTNIYALDAYKEEKKKSGSCARTYAKSLDEAIAGKTQDEIMLLDERFQPKKNIESGVRYVRWIIDNYPEFKIDGRTDIRLVLASYNAGANNIKTACCEQGICKAYHQCSRRLTREPKEYVDAVLEFAKSAEQEQ